MTQQEAILKLNDYTAEIMKTVIELTKIIKTLLTRIEELEEKLK